jgi:hypothetical protein
LTTLSLYAFTHHAEVFAARRDGPRSSMYKILNNSPKMFWHNTPRIAGRATLSDIRAPDELFRRLKDGISSGGFHGGSKIISSIRLKIIHCHFCSLLLGFSTTEKYLAYVCLEQSNGREWSFVKNGAPFYTM